MESSVSQSWVHLPSLSSVAFHISEVWKWEADGFSLILSVSCFLCKMGKYKQTLSSYTDLRVASNNDNVLIYIVNVIIHLISIMHN